MVTPEGPGSSGITVPESVTIDHASFDTTNNEDTQANSGNNSGKSFSFLLGPLSSVNLSICSTLRGCEQLPFYELEGYIIVRC